MSNYAGKFIPDDSNNPWNKAFDLIGKGAKVLDVGCSNGKFAEALIHFKSCIVDGVEPDKGDATKAKKIMRTVATSFMEQALDNEFKREQYDSIVFLDVIEHLYEPAQALRALHDHLKPGGNIIFSIPNMAHASVRIMLLGGDFNYGNTGLLDNTHLHFYTRDEIIGVFSEAGFNVNKWDATEAVYTKEVLKVELKKIGISKPTQELLDILSNNDAKIFQYIGSAQAGKSVKKDRPHYSPNPQGAITSYYEQHAKDVQMELQRLNEGALNYEKQVRDLTVSLLEKEKLMSEMTLAKHIRRSVRARIKGKK